MKILFVVTIILGAAYVSAQRRPRPPRPDEVLKATEGKRKPPPPTSSDEKRPESINGVIPPKANTRWIWDDNCKNDRPPFGLGRWIQVLYEECPIAFDDPRFDFYDNFCE